VTSAFAGDRSRVERGDRQEGTSSLGEWFDGDANVELSEEVVGLGRYGKVLTVLCADEIPGSDDDEEDDDDEWEPPTCHRSRRS